MSLLIKSSIPAKVAACDKLSVEENKTLEKIKASARKLDSVVSSRSFAQVPRALSDLYDALKEQVIFAHGKYFLIGKMKDIEPSLKKGLTAKDKDPYINDVFKLCKEVSAYLSQMFARADRLNAEDAAEDGDADFINSEEFKKAGKIVESIWLLIDRNKNAEAAKLFKENESFIRKYSHAPNHTIEELKRRALA